MQASDEARSHGSARREARTAAIRSICRLAAADRPMVLVPSGRVIWRPGTSAFGLRPGLTASISDQRLALPSCAAAMRPRVSPDRMT